VPSLLAVQGRKKISTQSTHTAAEKPVTRSTTPSNSQSNTDMQPFGAASGATVRQEARTATAKMRQDATLDQGRDATIVRREVTRSPKPPKPFPTQLS